MAKSKGVSDTKIYLASRKLFDEIVNVTENYPRYHKYCIGQKSVESCINMVRLIANAYSARDNETRLTYLSEFFSEFETLKFMMRVAIERRWIKSIGRQANIIELIDSIANQSAAWKNSLVKAEAKTGE